MKKSIGIKLIILLLSYTSYSQNEASNWYFGENAGIQFDINTGAITILNDGQLQTDEGCTSISDSNGDILFYTDGITVYNRNNLVMLNGDGLNGNPSSTQSAIIIPKPNDSNIYYIFTVDTAFIDDDDDDGFRYSEVDMTLDGGLGGVTLNKNILLIENTSEKISAVLKDCESQSIWVITFADSNGGEDNNSFYAYEVSDSGVNATPVVSPANIIVNDFRGYLKISPDGTKLAIANIREGLYLFDFDTTTGVVSNPQEIVININSNTEELQSSYGLEFSPNSDILYVTTYYVGVAGSNDAPENQYGALLQYDLTTTNISASEIVIDERIMFRSALQLGPNGKIYRTDSETYDIGSPFLSTINNPEILGVGCNYEHANISLGSNNSRQGLPPFISSFFRETIDIIQNGISTTNLSLCDGETYTLMAENIQGATYSWTKDNVSISTPNPPYELFIDGIINNNGDYKVLIEFNTNSICGVKEGQAIVSYFDIPIANQPQNIRQCDVTTTSTFDFITLDAEILDTQDPNSYSVAYFTSLNDANNNENSIQGTFTNTTNPQEIFARISNNGYENCYDTTSFFIEVFITPTIEPLTSITLCDTDYNSNPYDGITTLDLTEYSDTFIGNQDTSLYTITYHSSQEDADNDINAIQSPYTNTTPYNETIFIRLENNLNTQCYSTSSFTLTVTDAPLANDITVYQCDEDGIPEGFTIFNVSAFTEDIIGATNTNISIQFFLTEDNALNETDPINVDAFENTSNPQTLYTKVTDDNTMCINYSKILLRISTTHINDAAIQACDDDGIEDGFFSFDLSNADPIVLAGAPVGLPAVYYETYNDALLELNPITSNSYTNTTPYNQTIFARVENDNACFGISEVTLTVFDLPNIETAFETLYCLNDFPQTLVLDGGVIDDDPSNYFYEWSTGETTSEIEVNMAGTYTVRVSNTNGCFKDRTLSVLPSNIATINDVIVIDATDSNSITIEASGEGEYEYALNANGPFQLNPAFYNLQPGFYTVFVRDIKNNCGVVSQLVSVIGFPKFFTPNDDGDFDFWQVQGISTQFQPNSKILIFNRYGKLITELDPLGSGWDGNYNDKKMPTSDYWFKVTLQDGRVFTSHFTLKR